MFDQTDLTPIGKVGWR